MSIPFCCKWKKFLLRYNGAQKKEWDFTLYQNTIGGQEFYNRLKAPKNIKINFNVDEESLYILVNNNAFPSLYKTKPTNDYKLQHGDIYADMDLFEITEENGYGQEGEVIGYVYNFAISELNSLSGNSNKVELEFVLESDEIEKKLKKYKSSDWKTVKILKKLKALKRYRIAKKLKIL